MRKFLFSLCLLLVTSSASYSGTKEIVFNLGSDPGTIDPALNHTVDGTTVVMNIFEGLIRTDFNDNPEPASASSWDISPDGMTWTFHLRENLKWSDGKTLTSSHFRDGFLRALNPEIDSPYVYYGFFIKNGEAYYNGKASADDVGLYAPDDRTFIVELEYKNPLMLEYLAFPLFMPARLDIINDNPKDWTLKPETLISNGPFKFKNWKRGEGGEISLVKNPEYWEADKVQTDGLRFLFISDYMTALSAFKAGQIDYLNTIPSSILPLLLKTGEARPIPKLGTAFCDFNTTRKPFDDVRVRKAFSLAIDRNTIVDKITIGGERPASGLVCDQIPDADTVDDFRVKGGSFIPDAADVDEARRLLAEAGYPEGKGFPKVSYKYNSSTLNDDVAEILQWMWRENLGVEVELISYAEFKDFLEARIKKDYDIARDAWIMDFYDAGSILESCMSGSGLNDSGYSNPEFNELMNKASREMDRAKRIQYMHEAESILMNDMPVAPIYFYSSAVMQSERVRKIHASPFGYVLFRGAEVL